MGGQAPHGVTVAAALLVALVSTGGARAEAPSELTDAIRADLRIPAAIGRCSPWEWSPTVAFHEIRSGLYLVTVGHAAATQPSSLYLFDGARHVRIDSGDSGTVQIERVDLIGDRIEVMYFPTPSGDAPRLRSAVIEKAEGDWRVDRDTPYARVTALLAQVPADQVHGVGTRRYVLTIEHQTPVTSSSSVYLFEGASYVRLRTRGP